MNVKLVVDIDRELRQRAKMYALQHDISLREFVAQVIAEKLDSKEDDK